MERYICIHGHFYQPPRENPWLEAIEIQDSAYPYHDWNKRITAECYAPNFASRNLDGEGRILDIVSNYSRISYNFGPTLLSWIEINSPETYQAILNADKQSIEWRSGHGNAIAQIYNHIIMPLANTSDKRTQILWGIKDFEYRFKRFPEGMWLSETAVDNETLDILAESGIRFTILAPRQASKVRKIGTGKWRDVTGARIDPTRAYLCRLPSGRQIHIFFYDGPISQGVAFEGLLKRGEDFANRLLSGFSDLRQWPQILNIATDGETYGHHHRFGDMALAYALHYIESKGLARLTNYGEYLEKYHATYEVEIFENSSWSCIHGIERWRSNCGCNSGGHPNWNQEWRKPLRDALDWLRDRLAFIYENIASEYLKDPWQARDNYIDIILDRSTENVQRFLNKNASKSLSKEEKVSVSKLLEIQRHALLMYTSCGWFFDELSGLETVQVIQYAARAIQLSEELFADKIEDAFTMRLALAKSNMPEHENGAQIYEKLVKPAMIDLKKVGAHYAISSLFEEYIDETSIYSYQVKKEDYQRIEAGITKLAIGKISVSSKIIEESELVSFCVLHFGGHALNGGVRTFLGPEAYQSMKKEITSIFEQGDFADIVRLMDHHFGMHNYSLTNLFRDQQRNILTLLITKTLEDFEKTYRQIYENNKILMGFLRGTGMPLKRAFLSAAEVILNYDIKKAFMDEPIDVGRIQNLISDMKKWDVSLDSVDIEFAIRRALEEQMQKFYANPSDSTILLDIQQRLELLKLLPVEINYWQTQNIYYKIIRTTYYEILSKAKSGDENAMRWIDHFKYLGEMLFFDISSVLPEE
jgi:alpha-amylase/alpha-mannosidase (GH57 family)